MSHRIMSDWSEPHKVAQENREHARRAVAAHLERQMARLYNRRRNLALDEAAALAEVKLLRVPKGRA